MLLNFEGKLNYTKVPFLYLLIELHILNIKCIIYLKKR